MQNLRKMNHLARFIFCTALDSSVPFSTAVYIVGLGWLSIVITLQAGWYRFCFPAGAHVFLFEMSRLLKLRMGRAIPRFPLLLSWHRKWQLYPSFPCIAVLYVADNVTYIVYKPLIILWHLHCQSKLELPHWDHHLKKDVTGHMCSHSSVGGACADCIISFVNFLSWLMTYNAYYKNCVKSETWFGAMISKIVLIHIWKCMQTTSFTLHCAIFILLQEYL